MHTLKRLAIIDIKNYFADRRFTKEMLDEIQNKVIFKCHYYYKCKNCQKFKTYKNEFDKKAFWTLNREVKYWDVYNPDYSSRNRIFKLRPIRDPNFRI